MHWWGQTKCGKFKTFFLKGSLRVFHFQKNHNFTYMYGIGKPRGSEQNENGQKDKNKLVTKVVSPLHLSAAVEDNLQM